MRDTVAALIKMPLCSKVTREPFEANHVHCEVNAFVLCMSEVGIGIALG